MYQIIVKFGFGFFFTNNICIYLFVYLLAWQAFLTCWRLDTGICKLNRAKFLTDARTNVPFSIYIYIYVYVYIYIYATQCCLA